MLFDAFGQIFPCSSVTSTVIKLKSSLLALIFDLSGISLILAGFPAVAGQQIGYLTTTLKAYRANERNAGQYASVMQSISRNLSDEEIDALANYMHGLYK